MVEGNDQEVLMKNATLLKKAMEHPSMQGKGVDEVAATLFSREQVAEGTGATKPVDKNKEVLLRYRSYLG